VIAAKLLFALVLAVVGLIGLGDSLTASFFLKGPPLSWGKRTLYKPQLRDRWLALCISLAFVIYGGWLLIRLSLPAK
jgi:hypothetical protein